jgi:acyl-coenzyme A thioesterase 13
MQRAFPCLALTFFSIVGKTMAFTSIKFLNEKNEMFARGSHTKYIALAWKDPNNIVEELTPSKTTKEK